MDCDNEKLRNSVYIHFIIYFKVIFFISIKERRMKVSLHSATHINF